jgi:UDP-glucose 4-epimerase
MRAVVFGGAGFLGSFVADALSAAGHDAVVYDAVPSPYLQTNQEGIVGDILDEAKVREVVSGSDVIYNYAGIADIQAASLNPLETIRINTLGNTVILEASRLAGIRRFVFASTLYVYSQAGAFYRSSKQACELIIEDYQKTFGLPYTILRYGSLYGPRANQTNWIYSILRQCITESKIVRFGDGEEIREYIHVWDAAQSSVDILAPEFENANVIVTGQQTLRIKDLLRMISEMMGNRVALEYRASVEDPSTTIPDLHYQITPYHFNPKVARKLVRNTYIDLGQGLLDLINQVHQETHNLRNHAGVLVEANGVKEPPRE